MSTLDCLAEKAIIGFLIYGQLLFSLKTKYYAYSKETYLVLWTQVTKTLKEYKKSWGCSKHHWVKYFSSNVRTWHNDLNSHSQNHLNIHTSNNMHVYNQGTPKVRWDITTGKSQPLCLAGLAYTINTNKSIILKRGEVKDWQPNLSSDSHTNIVLHTHACTQHTQTHTVKKIWVSLGSPSWPRTHKDSPASASQI